MKRVLFFLFLLPQAASFAQQAAPSPGEKSFQSRCTVCHGGDGAGSERGPGITAYIASNPDEQIASTIRTGVRAMPAHNIADPEMRDLLAYLHSLRPAATGARGAQVVTAKLTNGTSLNGTIRNQTNFDMQLESADGKIHLLAKEGDLWRERDLLPKMNWTSYNGSDTGNRYSQLEQINRSNVERMVPKWVFPVPDAPRLEATPVVVDGIMYVTASNEAYAIDATTGRRIWQYRQPRTSGILGEAAGGAQRGVALDGDRVFMVTDHARLVALNRWNGQKIWDVQMGDYQKENASATVAPLIVGDLVIAGVAGGEEGVRGFVDAYKVSTGERAWRFWTIPKRGEKLAETWKGDALEHGCGATWMTGSYDRDLDLVYWGIGNPCPDYNGDQRIGDNLYTDSVVALNPKTGELKWYYQFTPHDTHDWDAEEPIVLMDEMWQGRPRKLMVQANRNGFFFVLDRTNGELLLATPFVKVNWASGYGKDGRPILVPNFNESSYEGTLTCPRAGANWPSASYSPVLKLFFVNSSDTCAILKKVDGPFEIGKRYFNGSATGVPGGRGSIRALDIQTGNKVWEYAPVGAGGGSSGTLATAGELVFIGESSGLFTALDARSGKPLWNFAANQSWRASPMTYMVGGKQFVVLAGPGGFFAFGLP